MPLAAIALDVLLTLYKSTGTSATALFDTYIVS
jgi:hypothetical protein